ncbi:MAG: DUF3108 domain-containing protein [Deltaproteobacteria bacterium]|nr:DUF3108 domain-containing protein [Deltaproteobacteria bacterium]
MKNRRAVLAVAALLVSAPAAAHDFAGETLAYEFGWNGIAAADVAVRVREGKCDRPCLTARIEANGRKYLDMFWKVRDRIEITCAKEQFRPMHYTFYQREGRFHLDTRIWHDEKSGRLRSSRFRVDQGKSYKDKDAEAGGTWGPISSILFMRSQPLTPGSNTTINVFDGKRTHELNWRVVGKERIKIELGEFDAIKVKPRIVRSEYKG